jgi:hypothetical protein
MDAPPGLRMNPCPVVERAAHRADGDVGPQRDVADRGADDLAGRVRRGSSVSSACSAGHVFASCLVTVYGLDVPSLRDAPFFVKLRTTNAFQTAKRHPVCV